MKNSCKSPFLLAITIIIFFLSLIIIISLSESAQYSFAQASIQKQDRVFVANELSNTISVIDPKNNSVEKTIDLTGFDNRKPFAFNSSKPLLSMSLTPLYKGAIFVHGMNSSPDGKIVAVTARGSSNIYLINSSTLEVIGPKTGIFVGREPHVPTFTNDGNSIWVTVRGSNYIAIIDLNEALANRPFYSKTIYTIDGPSMIWFSKDGKLAFVGSQKESRMDIIDTTSMKSIAIVNLTSADPSAFSPFVKVVPNGKEVWIVHKNSDSISSIKTDKKPFTILFTINLKKGDKPNHIEFSKNGKNTYVTLAKVNKTTNSSSIAIIDTIDKAILGYLDSHGKESHGIWANPEGTKLYVGHERTPQLSVFDISASNQINPNYITNIPLGNITMLNGQVLQNEKSIDVIYNRIQK
jgi:YVTN family beta-propeller protein